MTSVPQLATQLLRRRPVFVATMLITALLIGGLAFFAVRPTAPEEPLGRELARVVPLALVVGVVLAWASSI